MTFKILFTTPQNLHHPPHSGPTLRIENSIKALARIAEVTLYVRTSPGYIGGDDALTFYRSLCREVIFAPSVTPTNGLLHFLRRAANKVTRRILCRPLIGTDGLLEALDYRHLLDVIRDQQVDVVWLGYGNISYPLLRYLKAHTTVPVVVDTDSVWSRFILRELPYAQNEADRRRIQSEGNAKQIEEEWATPLADVTTAVSEVDADYFRGLVAPPDRVQLFANVIDPDSYADPNPAPSPVMRPAVYLAGTFWKGSPMEDAARWIIDAIMPLVWSRYPDMHLYIIGSGSDHVLADVTHPLITVTGQLKSVLPYLRNVDVSLVPLRFESGTRFKILEAGACATPVVSTTLGAEGLSVQHERDILIADDAPAFAAAICRLVEQPEQARLMGRALKELVTAQYSIEALGQQGRVILELLANRQREQR